MLHEIDERHGKLYYYLAIDFPFAFQCRECGNNPLGVILILNLVEHIARSGLNHLVDPLKFVLVDFCPDIQIYTLQDFPIIFFTFDLFTLVKIPNGNSFNCCDSLGWLILRQIKSVTLSPSPKQSLYS